MDTNNLVDSGHSIETNHKMWQNHKWVEGEWSPSQKWEIDFFEWFIKYAKNKETILEIGVGSGKWTKYLIEVAGTLIGVDLVEKAIEMCEEKFKDKFNAGFWKNDGRSLPFVKNESIDFIWSYDVFVHISPHDVKAYIEEFARVMKPGAIAVIHHGRGESRAGWRSTLTNEMFNSFLKENGLTLVDRVESWGKKNQYKVIHEDSISIFTK